MKYCINLKETIPFKSKPGMVEAPSWLVEVSRLRKGFIFEMKLREWGKKALIMYYYY